MQKINFQNLPSTTTPINATNLNQLQTNVDDGKIDKTVTQIASVSLDDQKTTGIYYCNSCTSAPTNASNGYLFVVAVSSAYIWQIYSNYNGSVTWERKCYGGTWENWVRVGSETQVDLTSYRVNSWASNGQNVGCILPNGSKLITVSVRRGTDVHAMNLPTSLKPTSSVLVPATDGSSAGYASIGTDGKVTVSSHIFVSGSSNLIFSAMYT